MNALTDLYQITSGWSGTKFCGLTIDWDYKARTIDISILGYVESVIHEFQNESQIGSQDSPHARIKPYHGASPLRTNPYDDSLPLDKTSRLQQFIGSYARVVAIGTIGAIACAAPRPATNIKVPKSPPKPSLNCSNTAAPHRW